jgi:hypothetical protein
MKKWLIMGMGLSLLLMALTQVGLGQEKAPGPSSVDAKTMETIQGIVVDAPVLKRGVLPQMEYLTLKTTDRGKLDVMLGPSWYLAQQDWKISALDRLEITGIRIKYKNRPILMAQNVKKGKKVMEFRDTSGRPLWSVPWKKAQ